MRRGRGLLAVVVALVLASALVGWDVAFRSPIPVRTASGSSAMANGVHVVAGASNHLATAVTAAARAFPAGAEAGVAPSEPAPVVAAAPGAEQPARLASARRPRPSRATERPIAPPPASFDGPAARPAPPPPQLADGSARGGAAGTGVWAVIVGINDYPGTRYDLRSAVNDALDVNEALARFGVPGSQRMLVRDGQGSSGTMAAAADWLVANAGPNATAVFFYAGHIRKANGREAIVGADGRLLYDADLAARLRGLQARHTWIALAACYGGGFNEVLAPGRVLTAAADANSLAYENDGFGRSYMVEYMVRQAMIQGRAPQSVQSAYAYARQRLEREYPGRAPVQYDQAGGAVDVHQPGTRSAGGSTSAGSGGGSSPTTTAPKRCGLICFE